MSVVLRLWPLPLLLVAPSPPQPLPFAAWAESRTLLLWRWNTTAPRTPCWGLPPPEFLPSDTPLSRPVDSSEFASETEQRVMGMQTIGIDSCRVIPVRWWATWKMTRVMAQVTASVCPMIQTNAPLAPTQSMKTAGNGWWAYLVWRDYLLR